MLEQAIDLSGRRILVVEDDVALANALCARLRECGATVLGPAPTCYYAYNLLMGRRGVDGAILDTKLYGSDVYELAGELRTRGIPLVFASEEGDGPIASAFSNELQLQKPVELDELLDKAGWLRGESVTVAPRPRMAPMPASKVAMGAGPLADRLARALARAIPLVH